MKDKKGGDKLKIRNTRKLYIPFYLMIFTLIASIIYIEYSKRPLDSLALKLTLAFIAAVLIVVEIHRLGNSYEVDKNSIVHNQGYLSIVSKRIEFGAISDIDVKQNIWQRVFSFGNVQIFKFSEKSTIKNINKPFYFVNFLEGKMRHTGGRTQ